LRRGSQNSLPPGSLVRMDLAASLKLALDPGEILRAQGITPDPWQQEFLLSNDREILLNCCRGAGKSRTTSARAVHTALFRPKSLTLLISRSQRQAKEIMRYCKQGLKAVGWPIPPHQGEPARGKSGTLGSPLARTWPGANTHRTAPAPVPEVP